MTEKPETLNNQAILLAADGAFTEAIACFKRAIVIEKDNYLLWFNLGVTYRDAGELKKAKQALETAYSIAPENDDVVETYATICLALKEIPIVQKICSQKILDDTNNPHFYNLMGVCCFQQEDYDNAAEFFEQAVFLNPYYADALFNLKDTYSLQKNKIGEEECAKKLKELKQR